MENFDKMFQPFKEKMQKENLPGLVIDTFRYYYSLLLKGESGTIPESTISPVDSLPDLENLGSDYFETGKDNLNSTVIIKLNGGLGTSMGLNKAKSLLEVKNKLTFLDIIAKQSEVSNVPFILMNSFNTKDDSLDLLKKYTQVDEKLPVDFLQHKIPKIDKKTLKPVEWNANPKLEWCPPGHGEIYIAMHISGILELLIANNYQYAFISNSDNLGSFLDVNLLGYFVQSGYSFLMEVADRTEADRKGGHLARLKNGQLILRESAQCPDEDLPEFQNINKHKYFNTNNIWIDLKALQNVLKEKKYNLKLPMIRNEKNVDPRDHSSPKVYQLETAMGSAISVFKGASAIRVPRTRFAPVKTTDDLLAVRSDAYILTDEFKLIPNPGRKLGKLFINLDKKYYKKVEDFENRFPKGVPSFLECEELTVKGDVKFGGNIKLAGKINLVNNTHGQISIADNEKIIR